MPRSQSDADSTSRFIDCIRDTVAHYGEPHTRAVLRCCCQGSVAEDWIAGVSDDDRALLRMNCSNWTAILERDFMPFLASRLSMARAEVFRWNQGRTPAEYVAKKLRLLRMANVVQDDEVVEELHRGFAATPNLHLHLDKYVSEVGNSVSEYRRVVVRLQDSTRCEGDGTLPQSRIGKHRPPFRHSSGNWSSNTSQPHLPATHGGMGAPTTGTSITGSAASGTTLLSSTSVRVAPHANKPRERLRKCKNYPECGEGEHWDWQCSIKKAAGSELKRAYYADPQNWEVDDSDNVSKLLYDSLDPQADLEEEYEHAQNAYFATRYRQEAGLGFLGTLSSQRQKQVLCRNCNSSFSSNNKLHKHLRAQCLPVKNHTADQPIIVKSATPASSNFVEGLADFHYAKTLWYTSPNGSSHVVCIDSGFGNSAVDDELQCRLYPDAVRLPLPKPRVVEGLGGAECTATHVVIMRIFMNGADGRFAELVRPFHIFKDLSVPLLIGNDIMKPEKFDLLYLSNRLRIGACDGISVQISVHAGHLFTRIPVRYAATVNILSGSSMIVGVKFARALKLNQDYQFTPIQTRSTISGAGAPHLVLRHNQKELLYTNFANRPLMIFKGTVLGHIRSLETSSSLSWEDASKDIKALFGTTRETTYALTAAEVFDLHQTDDSSPDRAGVAGVFLEDTRPCPIPAQSKHPVSDNALPCASEIFENPHWLQEDYVPQYDHVLPPYIKVHNVTTLTWEQVIINREDDISDAQVTALESLIRRHQCIFNNVMGCVREPKEDWLRINVPAELEAKLKPTELYRLTARGRKALDEQFDLNREYGRMAALEQPSPWDLKFLWFTEEQKLVQWLICAN